MPEKVREVEPPTGLTWLAFRLSIWFDFAIIASSIAVCGMLYTLWIVSFLFSRLNHIR